MSEFSNKTGKIREKIFSSETCAGERAWCPSQSEDERAEEQASEHAGRAKRVEEEIFSLNTKAFTLIELVITLGVIVLLSGISFLFIANYKNNQNINSTSQEIAVVLRNAQNRSLSQEGGSRWGVHFENPLSGGDFYDLFKGASYSPGLLVSRSALPTGIKFEIPFDGSSSTIIFSPVSGLPDNSLIVKIVLISSSMVSSTITINQNGQIIY